MEIKSFKLLILSLFFSFHLHSDDNLPNKVNFFEINEKQIINNRDVGDQLPLQGVVLEFDKIIRKFNVNEKDIKKDSFSSDSSSRDKSMLAQNELYLQPGEYIRVVERGSIELLSDGSFFVKFSETPNLKDFATLNQLIFVRDLSDINMGVFKVRNLYDLKPTLELLRDDINILSVKLDTIDPSVKSK